MIISTLDQKNLLTDAYQSLKGLYNLLNEDILMKKFHLKTISYCFTNFKDAIFHFFQMCIIDNERERFDQYFAMKEHITRAEKDYFTHGLNLLNYCVEKLIQNITNVSVKTELRTVLHMSKYLVFTIRSGGMLMNFSNGTIKKDEFVHCIESVQTVVIKNDLAADFGRYIKEYKNIK